MNVLNGEIARIFARIADSLEILDENGFKINAYRKASRGISSLARNLEEFDGQKELRTIPGVGKDLAAKIIEYTETGRIAYHEDVKKKVPDELAELLEIRGVGPKFLKTVVKLFGVSDIKSLKKTVKNPALRATRSMGEKKIRDIARAIEVFESGKQRTRITEAYRSASSIMKETETIPGVARVELAGSMRRMRETVGNIDLIAVSDDPAAVPEKFAALPFVGEVLKKTTDGSRVLAKDGMRTDLLVVKPEQFGSALLFLTGSGAHNSRLSEIAKREGFETKPLGIHGSDGYFSSEEEIYESLGLRYVAPEMREDRGEIEAASGGKLPQLLELKDIRGDLHTHSTWSDGASTIREMAKKAISLGYEYIAVTDHSPSSRIANGLSMDRLLRKKTEVEKINAGLPEITLLMGSEVDIRPDGSLDYPDETLRCLDFVVASVHSSFSMEEDRMTKRICSAIENPHVDAIGHPTGRLIGQREPYRVDIDAVIRAARDHDKALEVNSSYKRLDLKDTHVRKALDEGVKLIVSTDAHRTEHLERMIFGIGTARRGWAEKKDVVNALCLPELLEWLASHDV